MKPINRTDEKIKEEVKRDVARYYDRILGCSHKVIGNDFIYTPTAHWWPHRTKTGGISAIKVCRQLGVWNTHSAGVPGGSIIDAYMLVNSCSNGKAITALAEMMNLPDSYLRPESTPPPTVKPQQSDAELKAAIEAITTRNAIPIEPVPDTAPAPPDHYEFGKPDVLYRYPDTDGSLLHYAARWNESADRLKKEMRPLVYFPDGWDYDTRDMPKGRIYGLDRLVAHPTWNVLWVEGQKACNAAVARAKAEGLEIVPIAKGVKDTDYTPLQGRNVLLLPDNDKAGTEHVERVSKKLAALGCGLWDVPIAEGTPDGGDIADWPDTTKLADVIALATQRLAPLSDIDSDPQHNSADLIFSDVWNGDVLTANAVDTLAYVESDWRVCVDGVWHKQPEKALDVARDVGRQIRQNYAPFEGHNKTGYKSLGNIKTLERMLVAARGALLADANEFDQHPMFLPLKDKILDLDSGHAIDHDAKYKISTVAPVIYTPGAKAPLFESAISRLAMGSAEIESFYMRMFGYACTGRMTEQKMFVLVGPGHNGKTTPLIAIAHALGNLSWTAKPFMFARKHAARAHDQSGPTHSLANLRGKRFIYCGEVDESFEWIPTLINCFTGGEEITADPKNRDEIRYSPVGKIFYVCNDVPIMPTTNDGAWRRLLYIPTCSAISADERDDFYQEKIKTESAGILRILQDGVDDWKNGGLRVPDSIEAFTLKKRGGSDAVSMFIGEECVKFPGYTWRTAEAYDMYKSYCDRNSRSAVKIGAFTKQVNAMGYRKDGRVQGLTYFQGIKPKLVPMESIEVNG